MNNDQLLEKIRKVVQEENEPLKQGQERLEQGQARLENGHAHIATALEAVKAGLDDTQETVRKIDEGLVEMKPKMEEITKDHEERITQLEEAANLTRKN